MAWALIAFAFLFLAMFFVWSLCVVAGRADDWFK
jgi:hypothetical protein